MPCSDRTGLSSARTLFMAQGCLDQAAPYRSAYWGAPAAHTRAVEVVGAAESDPIRTFAPASSRTRQSHNFFVLADCSITRSALTVPFGALPCRQVSAGRRKHPGAGLGLGFPDLPAFAR